MVQIDLAILSTHFRFTAETVDDRFGEVAVAQLLFFTCCFSPHRGAHDDHATIVVRQFAGEFIEP